MASTWLGHSIDVDVMSIEDRKWEDAGLHEKMGYLRGLLEGLEKAQISATNDLKNDQAEFRIEVRKYVENHSLAHTNITTALNKVATTQAVEKVKLAAIVSVCTLGLNTAISWFLNH